MIFMEYFYRQPKLPKYAEPVVQVMALAEHKLFNSVDDLEQLVKVMEKKLEQNRPKNSSACIHFYKAATDKSGGVYLNLKQDNGHSSSAARLSYMQVDGAIEYDPDTSGFFYFNMEDNRLKFHDIIGKEGEPCQQ